MKITFLNGNPNVEYKTFDHYLVTLSSRLLEQDHDAQILNLKDMNIGYCMGCFDCWVKTPGMCINKDDSSQVCEEAINSDLLIFASPLIMGFTSALLKKANDKLLPLILYSIELVEDEYHHRARYNKYPYIGLLLSKENDTDDEDVNITSEIYRRDAINFKTSLRFTRLIEDPIEEVIHEINTI